MPLLKLRGSFFPSKYFSKFRSYTLEYLFLFWPYDLSSLVDVKFSIDMAD